MTVSTVNVTTGEEKNEKTETGREREREGDDDDDDLTNVMHPTVRKKEQHFFPSSCQ